jgi:hypothetical protein
MTRSPSRKSKSTAVAVLVGADKEERSGGSHVTRAMKCLVELRLFSCVAFPTGDAHAGASHIGRPVLGDLPRQRKIS